MGARPSTLYAVRDPLTAFCFDRGVTLFGNLLEEKVREAAQGAKGEKQARAAALRVLDRWLSSADPEEERQVSPGRFRDPFAEGLVPSA